MVDETCRFLRIGEVTTAPDWGLLSHKICSFPKTTTADSTVAMHGLLIVTHFPQERYQHRAVAPVRVLAEIGRGNPKDECWLNHPGVTMKNPLNDART